MKFDRRLYRISFPASQSVGGDIVYSCQSLLFTVTATNWYPVGLDPQRSAKLKRVACNYKDRDDIFIMFAEQDAT